MKRFSNAFNIFLKKENMGKRKSCFGLFLPFLSAFFFIPAQRFWPMR